VGTEGKVYHWGKTNGVLRSTADATSSSLFSVAYNKEPTHLQVHSPTLRSHCVIRAAPWDPFRMINQGCASIQVLAVSGNSANVDIYTSLGNRSFSLKFQ
jgi:hypothetical protein